MIINDLIIHPVKRTLRSSTKEKISKSMTGKTRESQRKCSEEDRKFINKKFNSKEMTAKDLAAMFNVSLKTIYKYSKFNL